MRSTATEWAQVDRTWHVTGILEHGSRHIKGKNSRYVKGTFTSKHCTTRNCSIRARTRGRGAGSLNPRTAVRVTLRSSPFEGSTLDDHILHVSLSSIPVSCNMCFQLARDCPVPRSEWTRQYPHTPTVPRKKQRKHTKLFSFAR